MRQFGVSGDTTLVTHTPPTSLHSLSHQLTTADAAASTAASRRRYREGFIERWRGHADVRHESFGAAWGRTHTCSTRKTGATRREPFLRGWLRSSSPTGWLTAHVATPLRVLVYVRSTISLRNVPHPHVNEKQAAAAGGIRAPDVRVLV
jgi:hypothetical protein